MEKIRKTSKQKVFIFLEELYSFYYFQRKRVENAFFQGEREFS